MPFRIAAVIAVLVCAASIAQAGNFVRSFAITNDTYLDAGDELQSKSAEITVQWQARNADEKVPMFLLAANAMQGGETFDSARVVIFPVMSPSFEANAVLYHILSAPTLTEESWLRRDATHLWEIAGAWGATDVDLANPLYSFAMWTGSLDSVTIARGAVFSTFVADTVLGSNAWVALHDDGLDTSALHVWSSYEGPPGPMQLRIYGHRPVSIHRRVILNDQP